MSLTWFCIRFCNFYNVATEGLRDQWTDQWMDRPMEKWTKRWTNIPSYTDVINLTKDVDFPTDYATFTNALQIDRRTNGPTNWRTNRRIYKPSYKMRFLAIVDLGKSNHSKLFGPACQRQNLLRVGPRRYFGDPLEHQKELFWLSSDGLDCAGKKFHTCLIPEVASGEKSESAIFTIFPSKTFPRRVVSNLKNST